MDQPGPMQNEEVDGEDVSTLAALLQPVVEAVEGQKERARRSAALRAGVLVILLLAAIVFTQGWPILPRVFLLIGWGILFLLVPSSSAFPLLRPAARAEAQDESAVLRALAEVDDPAAVGILIEAEGASSGERQAAIQAALTRLLPRMAGGGSPRLTDAQKDRLFTHLDALSKLANYSTQPTNFNAYPLGGSWERTRIVTEKFPELRDEYEAFLVAILTALPVLGGAEALPHVESVAQVKAPSEQMERIQQAAWNCLAAIHEQLEAEREGRTLLRPTTEPADRLLHPARSPESAAPESLLRPTLPEE